MLQWEMNLGEDVVGLNERIVSAIEFLYHFA